MNVPRLILHVGHPKTGTSALQSSFALSVEALAAQGIHYSPAGSLDLARDGKITSGNVNPLRLVETYNRAVRTAAGAEAVLLSNEACFIAFEKDPAPLRRLTEQGVPVEIVLFLRDPLDWAGSSYMQSIKRHGGKRSFSEFLPNARFLERVEHFLEICDALSLPVSTANYSRCEGGLVPRMEALLSLPPGTLAAPAGGRINRSMTLSEAYLLRRINADLGRPAARAVSTALCERLPDIAPERPDLTREAFDAFADRSRPIADRLNARLAAEDHLVLPDYDDVFAGIEAVEQVGLTFSAAQVRAITEALGEVMASPQDHPDRSTPGIGSQRSGNRAFWNRLSRALPLRRR